GDDQPGASQVSQGHAAARRGARLQGVLVPIQQLSVSGLRGAHPGDSAEHAGAGGVGIRHALPAPLHLVLLPHTPRQGSGPAFLNGVRQTKKTRFPKDSGPRPLGVNEETILVSSADRHWGGARSVSEVLALMADPAEGSGCFLNRFGILGSGIDRAWVNNRKTLPYPSQGTSLRITARVSSSTSARV